MTHKALPGPGPAPFLLLALFIDWWLTYNLIFHLLISPTEAASCQRGEGGGSMGTLSEKGKVLAGVGR